MTNYDDNEWMEKSANAFFRFVVRTAILCVIALVVIWLTTAEGAQVSDERRLAKGRIIVEALRDRINADANSPAWKRELIGHAAVHADEVEMFQAHTLYYHPREAGANWRRWKGTATGTLVRPGVASCTAAHRSRWLGAWVWFKGHGLCKVEDVFPELSSRNTFDLAVWAKPGQSYESWLWDPSRVVIARNRNVYTTALVVKPRGGW